MSGVVTALSTGLSEEAIYFVIHDIVYFVCTLAIVFICYYVITKAVSSASKGKADV